MTILVALILALLTFAFIIYPLFKQRSPSADSVVEDEKLQELHSKRNTAYSMLKELEFDFQSGILAEEDYRHLETRYKRKAISILKDTDALEKGTSVEDEIEKHVLEIRQSKGQFCPQCGAGYRESDHFCSGCGASLSKESRVD